MKFEFPLAIQIQNGNATAEFSTRQIAIHDSNGKSSTLTNGSVYLTDNVNHNTNSVTPYNTQIINPTGSKNYQSAEQIIMSLDGNPTQTFIISTNF